MSLDWKSRLGILAGGNFITDYGKIIDVWPEQDTLVSIQSEVVSNGGGPYNVLKDWARLAPNLPRAAVGLVGNDLNGDWIVRDCQEAGINVQQIHRTDEASTSYTDAMTVAETGRRTFFHQRGCNSLLAPEHFGFDANQTSARIFYLGYLMLLDEMDVVKSGGSTAAADVLSDAKAVGMTTAVDCVSQPGSNFRQVVLAAAKHADVLFMNEFEIGQVLGRSIEQEKFAMGTAATELLKLTARTDLQVVLHAASGAVVACGDGLIVDMPSINMPAEKVAGASGAGDAFAAGYLLGVHNEETVEQCLRFAICSAAMSVTDPTPSGGLCELEQCLALPNQFGFNAW